MTEKLPKKDVQEALAAQKKEPAHEKLEGLVHEVLKGLPSEEKKTGLLEVDRKELEQDLVRLQAEFENYKKRTMKELSEARDVGKMEFARSLLSFLDEFEHAMGHFNSKHRKMATGTSAEINHLLSEYEKGMAMLHTNLLKIMNNYGVREMKCEGEKYDPYKHEVVLQQESDSEPGTILTVTRKGYFFKDSVLRHAQVIVAKKKENIATKKGD